MRFKASAVGFALLLAGCGGGSSNDQAEPTATAGTKAETTDPAVRSTKVEGEPPSTAELVGTWSRIGSAGLVRFGADGDFRIARNQRDLLESPYAEGTYQVTGTTLVLLGGSGDACRWDAGLEDEKDPLDDELHIVVAEDGCGLTAGTVFMLVRISGS